MPERSIEIITNCFGKIPKTVVDLGCGTGLSTRMWQGKCSEVIGIEPSGDMIKIAKSKVSEGERFIQAFSHETGLDDKCADVVVCSQSFHWMNPSETLKEVNRILVKNGVFATVDCDWPPVFDWKIESEYFSLFDKVNKIEAENESVKKTFKRWDKQRHLENIKLSGYFRFSREIVFENVCEYDAKHFINLALSQGGFRTILREEPELIKKDVEVFEKNVINLFGNEKRKVSFCYRMRIGVK